MVVALSVPRLFVGEWDGVGRVFVQDAAITYKNLSEEAAIKVNLNYEAPGRPNMRARLSPTLP